MAKLAGRAAVPRCGRARRRAARKPRGWGRCRRAPAPAPTRLVLHGSAYLTGPYNGAPYGLAVEVPAIAGPFNLGTVVVRQALHSTPRRARHGGVRPVPDDPRRHGRERADGRVPGALAAAWTSRSTGRISRSTPRAANRSDRCDVPVHRMARARRRSSPFQVDQLSGPAVRARRSERERDGAGQQSRRHHVQRDGASGGLGSRRRRPGRDREGRPAAAKAALLQADDVAESVPRRDVRSEPLQTATKAR